MTHNNEARSYNVRLDSRLVTAIERAMKRKKITSFSEAIRQAAAEWSGVKVVKLTRGRPRKDGGKDTNKQGG